MALNINSKEQSMYEKKNYFDKAIRSLSDREGIWLRDHLYMEYRDSFPNLPFTNIQEGLVIELSKFDNFKDITEKSLSAMRHSLVPNEEFKWLINNTRAQLYTYELLLQNENELDYDANRYTSSIMNRIFSMIDYAGVQDRRSMHLDKKIELVNSLEKQWENMIKYENYSKWLNKTDIKKINWSRNYLFSKKLLLDNVSNISDITEVRAIVLASLDSIDLLWKDNNDNISGLSDRKLIIIDKMKRAWSQQKYRDDGKTKSAYHLPLTKETKGRLEKMAEVKGLSQATMLDILINSAFSLEFIDTDGNERF